MTDQPRQIPAAVPTAPVFLLTAGQVAQMLNVSLSWVREHSSSKNPRLPAIKLGSGKTAVVRYHPADIIDFIQTQRLSAIERAAQRKWKN